MVQCGKYAHEEERATSAEAAQSSHEDLRNVPVFYVESMDLRHDQPREVQPALESFFYLYFSSQRFLCRLFDTLSPQDRERFNFDVTTIEWGLYLHQFCWGIKHFCLKEPLNHPLNDRETRLPNIRKGPRLCSTPLARARVCVCRNELISISLELRVRGPADTKPGFFSDITWAATHGPEEQPRISATFRREIIKSPRVQAEVLNLAKVLLISHALAFAPLPLHVLVYTFHGSHVLQGAVSAGFRSGKNRPPHSGHNGNGSLALST